MFSLFVLGAAFLTVGGIVVFCAAREDAEAYEDLPGEYREEKLRAMVGGAGLATLGVLLGILAALS